MPFSGIRALSPEKELLAVSDDGAIYQGARAWIMCLYGLIDYREWAFRLAQPAIMPLAKQMVTRISANRRPLSRMLGYGANDDSDRVLGPSRKENPSCTGSGSCSL